MPESVYSEGMPAFAKAEVVGPVEEALFGFGIGPQGAPDPGGSLRQVVVQLGVAHPHDRDVVHGTVGVQAIHVDGRHGAGRRVDRVGGIVGGARETRTEDSLGLTG